MSKQYIDGNRLPLGDTDWGLREELTLTLTNATPDTTTLFTVTGTVLIRLLAVCETSLTAAADAPTLEVGVSGSTASLIAQTTGTNIDVGEIWHDATPDAPVELSSVLTEKIISSDIILTIASGTVGVGQIKFIAAWYPLTLDGKVEVVKGGTQAASISSPSASPSDSPSASPSNSPSAS